MKIKSIILPAFTVIVLLSGCSYGLVGKSFFIRNYEDQAVNIHYKYYNYDNSTDSFGFVSPPKSEVLLADTLFPKEKIFRQFLYKSALYFDTIAITEIDSLNYQFSLPAKSTVSINRVYYGDNIEYIILNESDTIKFKHEHPYVENEALFDHDLVKYRIHFLSYSYYLVNIKLKDINNQ